MEQITRAILLDVPASMSPCSTPEPNPITSLQYFADIVEEVKESAIPESYWSRFDPDSADGTTMAERKSSKP